jgi:hypothetical protein
MRVYNNECKLRWHVVVYTVLTKLFASFCDKFAVGKLLTAQAAGSGIGNATWTF